MESFTCYRDEVQILRKMHRGLEVANRQSRDVETKVYG